jgi:predicted  nucleic acid-binding Zn-ribbon protein
LKRIKKQLLRKGSVETDDDDTGVVLDAKGNVISREDENLKLDDEFDDSVADMPDDYEVNYESYTDDEPYIVHFGRTNNK